MKASSPILSIDLGSEMCVSRVHPAKALAPIDFVPLANVTISKLAQPLNDSLGIFGIDACICTHFRLLQ